MVWNNRRMIDIAILDKSDGSQVVNTISQLAAMHGVPNSNILFDNDGVGGFVDGFIHGAREFHNGGRPQDEENYQNLKTQCYYKSGMGVNMGLYYIEPHVASRMYDDRMTVKQRMIWERKAIKRAKADHDGKLRIL